MFPNVIPPKPVEDALSPTNLDAVADALAAQYKASQQAAEPDLDLVADGLAGEFKKAGGVSVEPMDEATRQRIAEVERSAAGAKPQPAYPTIGPMTASQRWRGETSALPKPKAPKAEDIEYGKFAKFIDIPGQFATHFANMALWGVPEMATKALAKEELPAPMTPVSKVAGAAGSLFGMGFGKNAMAASPFKVTAKVVDKLYRYVPKTIPGQIFKDAVKSAASM